MSLVLNRWRCCGCVVCVQVAEMPHRIYYSDKYYDANDYEYRCVPTARSALAALAAAR